MRPHTLTCTFCRKSEHQVRKLVAGPGVYICDGCVDIAHRIITDSDQHGRNATWKCRIGRWIGARLESFGLSRAKSRDRRWTARSVEQPA